MKLLKLRFHRLIGVLGVQGKGIGDSDVDERMACMICHTYWSWIHAADNQILRSIQRGAVRLAADFFNSLVHGVMPESGGREKRWTMRNEGHRWVCWSPIMNTIRQTLRSGGTTIGSWMQLPNASVAEIMGSAGYDWVAVDMEHGSFSLDSLPGLFRALELGGTVPFARVAQNSAKDIKQALDAGARGIIVPMIETREDVENAVAWAKYPPAGTRGVGFSRANLFGKRFKGYFNSINEEIVMVAQIESIAAVRALDRILTVPGLDAIFIGPYDLSASMGLTGQFGHQEFVDAIKLAEQKAREHRVPMGLHVVEPDAEQIRAKIQDGYRFLAYGIDALFLHRSASNPMKTDGQ